MNGIHDMGGMDGFGPVQPETNEFVFHEPWEARVFGMSMASAGLAPAPILSSSGATVTSATRWSISVLSQIRVRPIDLSLIMHRFR